MANGDIDPDDVDDVDEPGLSLANRLWRLRQVQRRLITRLYRIERLFEKLERDVYELTTKVNTPQRNGMGWLNETVLKVIISAVVTLIVTLALGRLFIFPP